MMIAQAQRDATIRMMRTSLFASVARAKSAQKEKSISCASARVSVSIVCLPNCRCGRIMLRL